MTTSLPVAEQAPPSLWLVEPELDPELEAAPELDPAPELPPPELDPDPEPPPDPDPELDPAPLEPPEPLALGLPESTSLETGRVVVAPLHATTTSEAAVRAALPRRNSRRFESRFIEHVLPWKKPEAQAPRYDQRSSKWPLAAQNGIAIAP
jgi:hypothetical protein